MDSFPVAELGTEEHLPSLPPLVIPGAARLLEEQRRAIQRIADTARWLQEWQRPFLDLAHSLEKQWRPLLNAQLNLERLNEAVQVMAQPLVATQLPRLVIPEPSSVAAAMAPLATATTAALQETTQRLAPLVQEALHNMAWASEAARMVSSISSSVSRVLERAFAPLRDPRLWRRLRLHLMLRAIEDGDPEELALVFRPLGIHSPQPEHVEALWIVLHQPAVWRVVERHEPEPYLRKAVWKQAERLFRLRAESRLWFPAPGVEVQSLDAPLPDAENAAAVLDAIPAATPDPAAWLEQAEDERNGRRLIRWIADQLSREQRMLFLLVVQAGYDYREAARIAFPGLEGWRLDNKWKAVQKRVSNILTGKSRRRRHR